MAATIPVYTSRDVIMAWLETPIVGLSKDSFFEITPNSDITEADVGADGSVAISYLPDETAAFTLSLQQNSPSNEFLYAVLASQKANRKLIIGDFTVDDPSGFYSRIIGAHIKTVPTVSRGSTATGNDLKWSFFATEIIHTANGKYTKGLPAENYFA